MVRLENVLKISLQDVLKMSWRRLEDIWPRRIYWSWLRGLQDVLKTSSEEEDERRLHQDEYLLRYSSFDNKRKQSHRDVLQKRCSKKFRKIHKKTPVPARQLYLKKGSGTHRFFSFWFCFFEFWKNTFFIEYLWWLLLNKDLLNYRRPSPIVLFYSNGAKTSALITIICKTLEIKKYSSLLWIPFFRLEFLTLNLSHKSKVSFISICFAKIKLNVKD